MRVLEKAGYGRVPRIPEVGRWREWDPLGLASLAKPGSSGSMRDPSQRVSWRLMATAGMHTAHTIC